MKKLNFFDDYRKGYFVNLNQPVLSNLPQHSNEHHNFIIVDSACENTKNLLSQVSTNLLIFEIYQSIH